MMTLDVQNRYKKVVFLMVILSLAYSCDNSPIESLRFQDLFIKYSLPVEYIEYSCGEPIYHSSPGTEKCFAKGDVTRLYFKLEQGVDDIGILSPSEAVEHKITQIENLNSDVKVTHKSTTNTLGDGDYYKSFKRNYLYLEYIYYDEMKCINIRLESNGNEDEEKIFDKILRYCALLTIYDHYIMDSSRDTWIW